ncbi:alpha/beta fold hydrolase [Rhodoflexus caldus]|uniref:alpha/beta fold hydrolase n=1 Tax=Rhodoflexus caldus TaxID=2891236 RepID=UPI00202AA243|nr:alpha/beta fold hydrolase [Rhodoflexus caldus]
MLALRFFPCLLLGWFIFYAPRALSQSFCELGDFALENGQIIKQCRIGYRTFGRLNEDKNNAILFPTYFTGKSDALRSYVGGKGKMLDSTRYFIILTDALGNGVSSSPSNSTLQAGREFPLFTIADMVRTQEAMIRKQWGIEKLHAVIGISMGGMQAFQWMAAFPAKVGKMISLVGTPKLGFSDLLLWQSEIQPIEKALQTNGNLQQAMETTVLIHAYALYTPSWRNKNQKTADFQSFVQAEIQKSASFYPLDWAWQAKAMMAHNAYKTLPLDKLGELLKARGLIVYASQDLMVSPQACADLVQYSGAEHIVLTDDCGHLATGCNMGRISERVQAFLQKQ